MYTTTIVAAKVGFLRVGQTHVEALELDQTVSMSEGSELVENCGQFSLRIGRVASRGKAPNAIGSRDLRYQSPRFRVVVDPAIAFDPVHI